MRRVSPLPNKPLPDPQVSEQTFRDKNTLHPLLGSLFGVYKDFIGPAPGRVKNPLTYHEMKVHEQIANPQNKMNFYYQTYLNFGRYGMTSREAEDFVTANLEKAFFSYIEREFPLRNSSIELFSQYLQEYLADQFSKQQSFQAKYNNQRHTRTKDPRGMVCSSYPEVI